MGKFHNWERNMQCRIQRGKGETDYPGPERRWYRGTLKFTKIHKS